MARNASGATFWEESLCFGVVMPPKTGGPQGCDSEGGLSQKGGENVRLFRMRMMNTTPASYDDDLGQYRPRLFGIAFRMLGDVQDAEDLGQETRLRWQKAERKSVREPEAWLVAVVTRLAIDRLRQGPAKRRPPPRPGHPAPR